MTVEKYLDFLHLAEGLKNRTRHSVSSQGREESVAEHSWRLALMAMLLGQEFPQLNMSRVVEMCLIHDLGEAVTGDIPAFVKTQENRRAERAVVADITRMLPETERAYFQELYREMEAMESGEAKLYKALDRCEALLQHNEAPLPSWLALEYELQMVYGQEECQAFPFTAALRERLRQDSLEKIEREKPENLSRTQERGES